MKTAPITISDRAPRLDNGWEWVPLGDVAQLATGHTPDRSVPGYWNGGIPWISLTEIRDLDGRLADRTELSVSAEGIRHSSSVVLPAGTVCLSRTASIGFVTVMGTSMATSQDFVNWVCGPLLDPGYLMRALIASRKHVRSLSTGSTHKTLYMRVAERFRVLLPPIEEQRRIAAILDKADELRAKRRAALAQFDSLTQSIFLDMFGEPGANRHDWPMRSIRSIATSAAYGTSEKASDAGPLAVLRMGNLSSTGRIDLNNLKYMKLSDREFERYTVRRGDILFNRTNSADLVGKTAVYREDGPMAFAGYLVRLRLAPDADPEYLGALLNTRWAKTILRAMCKSIVGMANINANELQNIVVMVPPIDLQRKFADITRAVLARNGIHESALACHDELFASLQHRAFSGAL